MIAVPFITNLDHMVELLMGRVKLGNGSEQVRQVLNLTNQYMQYLDEYRSNQNDFTIFGFISLRRIQWT